MLIHRDYKFNKSIKNHNNREMHQRRRGLREDGTRWGDGPAANGTGSKRSEPVDCESGGQQRNGSGPGSSRGDDIMEEHLSKQAQNHLNLLGSSIYQIKNIAGQIKNSM